MPIKPPPSLSKDTKKLLFLLARLIAEPSNSGNVRDGDVALSDSEAERLVALLTSLLENKEFREVDSFIKKLTLSGLSAGPQLAKLYAAKLRKRNDNIVFKDHEWSEFALKLGMYGTPLDKKVTQPMKYGYFLKMEKMLFESTEIPPQATAILLKAVREQQEEVERLRMRPMYQVDVLNVIKTVKRGAEKRLIPRFNLISASIVVANASVLFTTRDWNAIGVLSSMAGALAGTFRSGG